MGDQGTGGIESRGLENNTTRRMSEACSNTHDEQMQSPTTEGEAQASEDKKVPTFTQRGPRRFGTPNTGTPVDTPTGFSSRTPISSSRGDYFHQRRSTGHRSRPLEPPVTKATLSELDVNKIVHNPKLRHDINFDPELHFRPNLDGEKGRRKQEKADQFWRALTEQLQQFLLEREAFMRQYGNGEEWCLPLLLKSVKEIIQTLVPARDRVYLEEGLNVDLIMQQFARGMADLEKLASWLSGVLKSHCAPMRDEWVDEMYNQLTEGNRDNNMKELVQGMRSLLSVLEAMKLDVANHQIRCLRPILIEDTVHFEQRFFLKKIRDRKLDCAPAQNWYSRVSMDYSQDSSSAQAFGDMAIFFEAMAKTTLPSNAEGLPTTFLFDEERIFKLRSDMLDAINLEICMQLYEKLDKNYRNQNLPTPVSAVSPYGNTPFSDSSEMLSPFPDEDVHDPDLHISRSRPSSIVFGSTSSASSSPRSSLIIESTPAFSRPEDHKSKSQKLYNSLIALLQTSPAMAQPQHRWQAMKDSLALQIFRFTNAPTEMLMQFEDEINAHLSNPSSPLFQEVEQTYHQRLLTEMQRRVKEFRGLTGVALFSTATGGRLQGPGRTWDGSRDGLRAEQNREAESPAREPRDESGIEDMATRLAHLGILHWRVWADLAYLRDMDSEMSQDE